MTKQNNPANQDNQQAPSLPAADHPFDWKGNVVIPIEDWNKLKMDVGMIFIKLLSLYPRM